MNTNKVNIVDNEIGPWEFNIFNPYMQFDKTTENVNKPKDINDQKNYFFNHKARKTKEQPNSLIELLEKKYKFPKINNNKKNNEIIKKNKYGTIDNKEIKNNNYLKLSLDLDKAVIQNSRQKYSHNKKYSNNFSERYFISPKEKFITYQKSKLENILQSLEQIKIKKNSKAICSENTYLNLNINAEKINFPKDPISPRIREDLKKTVSFFNKNKEKIDLKIKNFESISKSERNHKFRMTTTVFKSRVFIKSNRKFLKDEKTKKELEKIENEKDLTQRYKELEPFDDKFLL